MKFLKSKYGAIGALVYAVAAVIYLFSLFPCPNRYLSFCGSFDLVFITPPAVLIFGGHGIDFDHASPVTSDVTLIALYVGISVIIVYFIIALAEATPLRRASRVLLIIGTTGCGIFFISGIAGRGSLIRLAAFGIVVGLWAVLAYVLVLVVLNSIHSKWVHFVESKIADKQSDKDEAGNEKVAAEQ